MSSIFAQEWADASKNIDDIFGEPFIFRPFVQSDGKWIADASRAVVTITAALDEAAVFSEPIGQRNASGMSKGVVSQHATTQAVIDIASDALPYNPRAKDRLQRVSDSVVFEVSGVLQDNFARIGLRVVKLGAVVP